MAAGGIPEGAVGGGATAWRPDRVGRRARRRRHALGCGSGHVARPGGPLAGRRMAHHGHAAAPGRHGAARPGDPGGRHRLGGWSERRAIAGGQPVSRAPGKHRRRRGRTDTRHPRTHGWAAEPDAQPPPSPAPSAQSSPLQSVESSPAPSAGPKPTPKPTQKATPRPRPTPTPPVIVRDVTRAAGLERSTASYGAVRADFNGDGWPDLFIGRHSNPGWLVLNDHGTFVDAPGRLDPQARPARLHQRRCQR